MKIEDLHEAVRLNTHLEKLRKALEDLPSDEHVRLQVKQGLSHQEFTMHHELFCTALKEDIGNTKKALRDLGVEFPEDKK